MKTNHQLLFASLIFLVVAACSNSKKIETSQLPPSPIPREDSQVFEIPEDAIVITPKEYRASNTIVNDIVNTKLDVHFDWVKQHLIGKAWITFKPHFFTTDSLTLDAKSFDINKVELVNTKGNVALKYTYDSLQLKIKLDRSYSRNEFYTVYIDYTAKPNEVKQEGSATINDAKGLYFINADGKDKSKPRQLWTQGETESNSCWFPTVDKPNMKTTLEIAITAEKKQVTLSNGLMISSKQNADGSHTDTWKLDQPFAPYLVMMAVGPFTIVKDKWKKIEVNYYIDSAYNQYAKQIFGNTPEMIQHFSDLLGVDYAWPKYSQVVVHDYVSGAMENVSATLHGSYMNQTAREMIDGDREDVISHELFHQWFGNLVTCESWSNITLNESFADYGEYLWNEYKYGREEADYRFQNTLNGYLGNAESFSNPLVRFNYDSREDVFDGVSYNKGGRILHMLRNYVGDEAFFKSLNVYLTEHKYQSAEAHDLRLAFEKVTGKDLNWFFNQWYFAPGNPVLDISYSYNDSSKKVEVIVVQNQNRDNGVPLFEMPVAVDVYVNGKVNHYHATFKDKDQSIEFPCEAKPDLVNFDADKMLLCKKTDNKSDTAFAFQYRYAPLYIDRMEAVQYFNKNSSSPFYKEIVAQELKDTFWVIRNSAAKGISQKRLFKSPELIATMKKLAATDPKPNVRSTALTQLAGLKDSSNMYVFENALIDSSYDVITTALSLILAIDTSKAYSLAKGFEKDNSEDIALALFEVYSVAGTQSDNDYFVNKLKNGSGIFKYQGFQSYGNYLSRFVDDSVLLNSSLPMLYDAGINSTTWYVRFRAVTSLEEIQTAMSAKQDSVAKLYSGDQSNPQLSDQLRSITDRYTALSEKIEAIKAAEKDERLSGIYNRN
ncbi:MAG: HEAT repeat domain-containing protein [Chitinophagales bacterium]|nr:HEAT repeat domain-containing protein [Chitinophagales bacterium]